MFMKLPSFFSKTRRPIRQTRARPTVRPALERLEDRLAPATAVVSFSPDQQTVTIQADAQTWTIARPVVSPWNYQATGTTYWVATTGSDGAVGSSAHPFATIGHAVAAAGPGDVVYVEAGTYVENLNITKSGLPGRPIIISAAPGALGQVTITPSAQYVTANPGGAVVLLNNADYVWINGFVIEGPKGRPEAPLSEHYGAVGIGWWNDAGLGDEATNNVVYNNVHCGLKGGMGVLVEGNVVFDNGTNLLLDHGLYMPYNNVTMNGNVIFDNAGCGIQSYPEPVGQVITHNVIFGNKFAGILLGGSGNQVFDNTVTNNGDGVFYFRSGCQNNVVEYNIFAFNGVDSGVDHNPSNNTDDYNDYYTGKPNPLINPGTHEVLANPLFLNATGGDFRLAQASPASAEGAYVTTTDTSVASSAQTSVAGQSVTFTATVTDVGGGTPTGAVEFFDGTIDLGRGTALSGSGASATSMLSTSALSFGGHSIRAVYTATGAFQDSAGMVTQTVAAVTELAVLKADGSLWLFTPSSGGMDLLSGPGTILSVSAVLDGSGNTDVYAITSMYGTQNENRLWLHTVAGWTQLSSGEFLQASAATNSTGQNVVFGVLKDHSLWEQTPTFGPIGLDSGWRNLSPAGTIQSVSAVTDASGNDVVYAITADSHLWEHTPLGWTYLSAGLFQQISAGRDGAGQAVVFGVLTDHSLWENHGGGWQQLSAAGSILSVSAGGPDGVFAVTTDHHLWEHTAAGWAFLSSGLFTSLSGSQNQSGQSDVFAVLSDTSFWEYNPLFSGNWRDLIPSGVAFSAAT
jgi:parallel beta-helix repeat protein